MWGGGGNRCVKNACNFQTKTEEPLKRSLKSWRIKLRENNRGIPDRGRGQGQKPRSG